MRIALLADTYPPENRGGAGVVAERLARQFVRHGHAVLVVASSARDSSEVEQDGVRVCRLRSRYPERFRNFVAMANPLVLDGVRQALAGFRPDLVHAHNVHQHLSFAALEIAAATGAPVAYTAHDFLLFCCIKFICTDGAVDFRQRWFNCAKCQRFRWNPLRNRSIRRRMGAHVDQLFAISRALQTALRANGYGGAEVVPNGVDPEWWAEGDGARFRARFGLGDAPVALLAARVSREKGAEAALHALARTGDVRARLVIAGENPRYAPKLRRLAGELGVGERLLLPGWLGPEVMRDAYQAADVTLAPSTYPDPFNLTIVEGMAAGTPVIGSMLGAGPELVVDGETGYLVQPSDPAAFADRLSLLLDDPDRAAELGAAGRRRVTRHFTLDGQVRRTLTRYEALLAVRA
jgi:glycosyltransferase involved in cell wall biosynthesis